MERDNNATERENEMTIQAIQVTMTSQISGDDATMTRWVKLSEAEWDGNLEDVLAAVYRNGQNDFQQVEPGRPSVSVGDTIHIAEHAGRGHYRVMPCGFRILEDDEPVVAPAGEERRNLTLYGQLNEPGKAPLQSPATRNSSARQLTKLNKINWIDSQIRRALRAEAELGGLRPSGSLTVSEIVAGGWLTESQIRWRISPKSGTRRQEMHQLDGYKLDAGCRGKGIAPKRSAKFRLTGE
jgi:hypothetical protein